MTRNVLRAGERAKVLQLEVVLRPALFVNAPELKISLHKHLAKADLASSQSFGLRYHMGIISSLDNTKRFVNVNVTIVSLCEAL